VKNRVRDSIASTKSARERCALDDQESRKDGEAEVVRDRSASLSPAVSEQGHGVTTRSSRPRYRSVQPTPSRSPKRALCRRHRAWCARDWRRRSIPRAQRGARRFEAIVLQPVVFIRRRTHPPARHAAYRRSDPWRSRPAGFIETASCDSCSKASTCRSGRPLRSSPRSTRSISAPTIELPSTKKGARPRPTRPRDSLRRHLRFLALRGGMDHHDHLDPDGDGHIIQSGHPGALGAGGFLGLGMIGAVIGPIWRPAGIRPLRGRRGADHLLEHPREGAGSPVRRRHADRAAARTRPPRPAP